MNTMPKNNLTCKLCGVGFYQKPTSIRNNKGKVYCTEDCRKSDIGLREVQCGYCKKPFQVFPARIRKLTTLKIYCSKECCGLDQKQKIQVSCVQCGSSFELKRSHILHKKGAGSFCNMRCKAAYMSGSQLTTSGVNRNTTKRGGRRDDLGGQYFRSAWEANYARYLNWLIEQKQIVKWEFEPDTFEFKGIKRGTRFYTPDFKVFTGNDEYAYHEVKGWMDPASRTKLQRMAKYYPTEKVILIDRMPYMSIAKQMAGIIPNWE